MERGLRYGSLFSGIGGFDLGLDRAGMSCAWQVEINPFCVRVLEAHWPKVARHNDVKEVSGFDLEPVDVLVGGFPCQDLSTAGKRAGLAGERSGLFTEFVRIADEVAPSWIVVENVPGLLSSNEGEDFTVLLEGFTGLRPTVPKGGWRNSGICVGPKRGGAWRVLDAQFFGVAQRRRRVFIVFDSGDASSAVSVLFEPEGCPGGSPPQRQAGQTAPTLLASGAGTDRPAGIGSEADFLVARPLLGGGNDKRDATSMTYIPEVVPQAMSSKWSKMASGPAGDEVANLVALAMNGKPICAPDPAYTLAAGQGGSKFGSGRQGQDTSVVEPQIVAFTAKDGGQDALEDLSPTLRAMGHKDSHPNGGGQVAVTAIGRGSYPSTSDDVALPVTTRWGDPGHVFIPESDQEGCAASVNQREEVRRRKVHGALLSGKTRFNGVVAGGVRRLTPVECERLQGFPDNWTLVPTGQLRQVGEGLLHQRREAALMARFWEAIQTDDWDEVEKLCADSPRYRALGNAVVVNVSNWIGRRIVAAEGAASARKVVG